MRKRNYNLKLTGLAAAMASVGTLLSVPAFALQAVQKGDLTINVDTTLSAGAAFRASDVDYRQVGRFNAAAAQGVDPNSLPISTSTDTFTKHLHNSSVYDNGDLRWKKGKPYSQIVKGTIDVQAEYKDYGAFVRGKFFYDEAIMKGNGGTDLPRFYPTTESGAPSEPSQKIGSGAQFLDAFVYGNWTVDDKPLNVRLGQQVVNWGEGVLFANGINTINPINVGALLAPGSEVKEALIPVKMLYGSLGITEGLSLEAFYQFQWKKTVVPDCGTFFSTIDVVGDHCDAGYFAFSLDPGAKLSILTANMLNVGYAEDNEPDDGGEYGVAVRYYIDPIQTEVGLYYINYNSRLPILSGYAPSQAAIDSTAYYALAIGQRLTTSSISLEYPEDIHLFGVSFNTSIDFGLPGGETAVSGELSLRKNQPFQVEDSVLLSGLIGSPSQICQDGVDKNGDGLNCYDIYSADQFISGGIRKDFYQAEVSFIHFFDQLLGADRWTVLLDMAYDYAKIPDKSELLMNSAYNADTRPAWTALIDPAVSGAVLSGNTKAINDALYASGVGESKYYPTRSSYGYKLRFSGEYSNVFAGVNLVPTISFSQDLKGVTPGPVANFLEDRKALGLSVEANYLNTYKVEMGYTDFYGAEPYNQLNDRDFYSISASVSF